MKNYTSRELMKMNLDQLEKLTLDELIEAVCALEVTIYVIDSMEKNFTKEAQKQCEIKSLIRKYKTKSIIY